MDYDTYGRYVVVFEILCFILSYHLSRNVFPFFTTDLIFYTKQTITQVCECAGGRIRTDRPFTYTIASAKADSQGHDTSVGFVEAWIRYSQPLSPRGEFSDVDYHAAVDALDPALLERFGYSHPAPN